MIEKSAKTKPLNLDLFTQLNCFIFISRLEKCFEVTDVFPKLECEGDWAMFQSKNCLHRQSLSKY